MSRLASKRPARHHLRALAILALTALGLSTTIATSPPEWYLDTTATGAIEGGRSEVEIEVVTDGRNFDAAQQLTLTVYFSGTDKATILETRWRSEYENEGSKEVTLTESEDSSLDVNARISTYDLLACGGEGECVRTLRLERSGTAEQLAETIELEIKAELWGPDSDPPSGAGLVVRVAE